MKYTFLAFFGLIIWSFIKADITQAHSNNLSSDLYQLDSNLMNDKQWMDAPEYSLSGGMGFVGVLSYSDEYSAYGAAYLSVCGNGAIEENEVCDTNNFNNQTCSDLGFPEGTLTCTNNCQEISTVNCTSPIIYGGSGGSYGRTYVFRGVSSGRRSYLTQKEEVPKASASSIGKEKQPYSSASSKPLKKSSFSLDLTAHENTELKENTVRVSSMQNNQIQINVQKSKITKIKVDEEKGSHSEILSINALRQAVTLNNVMKEEVSSFLTSVVMNENTILDKKSFLSTQQLDTKLISSRTSLIPLSYTNYSSLISGGFNKLFTFKNDEDNEKGFINYVIEKSLDFIMKIYPSLFFRLSHIV